jgi:hypothetical protein
MSHSTFEDFVLLYPDTCDIIQTIYFDFGGLLAVGLGKLVHLWKTSCSSKFRRMPLEEKHGLPFYRFTLIFRHFRPYDFIFLGFSTFICPTASTTSQFCLWPLLFIFVSL